MTDPESAADLARALLADKVHYPDPDAIRLARLVLAEEAARPDREGMRAAVEQVLDFPNAFDAPSFTEWKRRMADAVLGALAAHQEDKVMTRRKCDRTHPPAATSRTPPTKEDQPCQP